MENAMQLNPDASTESSLLFVLRLLHHSFSQNLKYEGEDHIEPAQMKILMTLAKEPCTVTELAKLTSVKPPTASRSVNLLVKAGLVTRTVPENNRRITLLSLSPEGLEKMALFQKKAEEHVSFILRTLSTQERQVLDKGLNVLIDALQRQQCAG